MSQPSCLPSSQLDHVCVCATSRLRPLQLIRISGDEWDSESLEKPVTHWPRHPATASGFRGGTYSRRAQWRFWTHGSGGGVKKFRGRIFFFSFSFLFFVLSLTNQMSDSEQQGGRHRASSCWSWSVAERTPCLEETPQRRLEVEEEVCLEVSGTGEHWLRPAGRPCCCCWCCCCPAVALGQSLLLLFGLLCQYFKCAACFEKLQPVSYTNSLFSLFYNLSLKPY